MSKKEEGKAGGTARGVNLNTAQFLSLARDYVSRDLLITDIASAHNWNTAMLTEALLGSPSLLNWSDYPKLQWLLFMPSGCRKRGDQIRRLLNGFLYSDCQWVQYAKRANISAFTLNKYLELILPVFPELGRAILAKRDILRVTNQEVRVKNANTAKAIHYDKESILAMAKLYLSSNLTMAECAEICEVSTPIFSAAITQDLILVDEALFKEVIRKAEARRRRFKTESQLSDKEVLKIAEFFISRDDCTYEQIHKDLGYSLGAAKRALNSRLREVDLEMFKKVAAIFYKRGTVRRLSDTILLAT